MGRKRALRLLLPVLILILLLIALFRRPPTRPSPAPPRPVVHHEEPTPVETTPPVSRTLPPATPHHPPPPIPPPSVIQRPAPPVEPTPPGEPFLTGRVSLEGRRPRRRKILGHNLVCPAHHEAPPLWDDSIVVDEQGGVQWAFVWISTGVAGTFPPPDEPAVLATEGCRFNPHVMGVLTGQELLVRNRDPILHNAHALSFNNREFITALAPDQPAFRHTFPLKEVMIRIKSDIHPWMGGWVGVVPHPYFAVTNPQGIYEIKGLKPGRYTLEVWHERYRPVSTKIAFDGYAVVDFTLKATK